MKTFMTLRVRFLHGHVGRQKHTAHSLRWLFMRGHLYFLNCATALLSNAMISSCGPKTTQNHTMLNSPSFINIIEWLKCENAPALFRSFVKLKVKV